MNAEDVRRRWANRSGEFSPDYYAHRGPDDTSEAIRVLLDRSVDRDASVLELGCSSGRHLAHLHAAGFRDLTGIEVNDDAIDVMTEMYPDVAAAGTFHIDAMENVLEGFEDDAFAAVYSVETLQHVHPDSDWVFAELARITDTLLITVENEGAEGRRTGSKNTRTSDGDADADGNGTDEDRHKGDADESDPDLNYVDEGVPLYYRDWHRVFTELGFAEVETQSHPRDTLRAFRPPRF